MVNPEQFIPYKGNPSNALKATFDQADTNRDGVLDREEFARLRGQSQSPDIAAPPPSLQDPWKREPPWAAQPGYGGRGNSENGPGPWEEMAARR